MSEQTGLEFPCDFPIKMMGRDTPEFRATARALVEVRAGAVADSAVQAAVSRNGRFVSVTVTITATSQQQLDDIYRDASSHDDMRAQNPRAMKFGSPSTRPYSRWVSMPARNICSRLVTSPSCRSTGAAR